MNSIRLTLSFFTLAITAYASVAEVIRVQGNVQITHANHTSQKATLTSLLENGDVITVGSNSRTQIRFDDATVITLGRNTVFAIDTYFFDTTKASKAEFNLVEGSFKFLTGNIGKVAPERFKLITKTATIGIRGTYVAGNFKDNILGVLYLGKGKGAFVENQAGHTDLTQIGQGVFVGLHEVPKKPLFWTKSQSVDLLNELNFQEHDALPQENTEYLNKSSLKGNIALYSFSNHTNKNDVDTSGAVVELLYTTPSHYDLSGDIGFFTQLPADNTKPSSFSQELNSLHLASLAWSPKNSIIRIGRQKLVTPLSDSSNLHGLVSLELRNHWYDEKNTQDWWWTTPSAFEAINIEVYEIEDVKIMASIAQSFKRSALDKFSSSLPSTDDFGNIYLAGLEYKAYSSKFQFYDLYADKFINTAYFQADFLSKHQDFGYFGAMQYIHQRSVNDFEKDIRSSLWGAKAGAYYKGWQLWSAISQTEKKRDGEINGILTPFDGMNAFTNAYALRNVLPRTYNTPLSFDGAYGADTFGEKIALEYDGHYDKLAPLSGMIAFSEFEQKNAKNKATEIDFDIGYRFEKSLNGLNLNVKVSQLKNSDFIDAKEDIVRFIMRYNY